MNRRTFLTRLAIGGGAAAIAPSLLAQASRSMPAPSGGPAQGTTSNLFNMDQDAALTVVRPRKPNAQPSMTADDRDALEHQLRCQCGCTLDVYTCRTTDFSCQVSPAMHRDVMALVDGGHSAQEIIDAFVQTYGERVLMAPKREGFNWAGYAVPFVVLGAGAAGLAGVLRRLRRVPRDTEGAPAAAGMRASVEELAELDAAVRRDE